MLSRGFLRRYRFGGGGGGHSHHVALNQTQNWIAAPQFLTLQGFEERNHHPHELVEDPFHHLEGKSLLSFERLYFSDPHYHEDDHEMLMNQPHGYLTNDDPFDTRSGQDQAALEFIMISQTIFMFGLVYGIHGIIFRGPGDQLYQDVLTAEQLEDEIRRIREQNYTLEKRRDELKAQLE